MSNVEYTLVLTDYIIVPYLIGFSLWLVRSIMKINENQIRMEERQDQMLRKEDYYKQKK